MELALFVILALVAIVSAAGMILSKNAVHSALFLILNFGCVALLFLMLDAPFISMVQIAVYAGAIMVLFLFVIMLLGAEQTTDTEARQFGWLTGAATVLGAVFLVAMAFTLVTEGGLDLPEATGEAPRLRLVHAANVDSSLTITVDGEPLEEDALLLNEATDFIEVESGEHTIAFLDEAEATLFETTLALEPDQVLTAVVYGAERIEGLATISNNLESSADDEARVNVLNLVTENPLFLVDLGRDRQLTVETGEETGIRDGVLTDGAETDEVDALVYGEAVAIVIPDGTYNIRFVEEIEPGSYDVVARIGGEESWSFEEGTEQTLIFTPDYASTADQFGYRATVLEYELAISEPFGAPGDIGGLLFIDYLLPVNLVGFLLLVALVGVIVLTRPEITTSRRSTLNRRRKVSRPLVSVITEQTGRDVAVNIPELDDPATKQGD